MALRGGKAGRWSDDRDREIVLSGEKLTAREMVVRGGEVMDRERVAG